MPSFNTIHPLIPFTKKREMPQPITNNLSQYIGPTCPCQIIFFFHFLFFCLPPLARPSRRDNPMHDLHSCRPFSPPPPPHRPWCPFSPLLLNLKLHRCHRHGPQIRSVGGVTVVTVGGTDKENTRRAGLGDGVGGEKASATSLPQGSSPSLRARGLRRRRFGSAP